MHHMLKNDKYMWFLINTSRQANLLVPLLHHYSFYIAHKYNSIFLVNDVTQNMTRRYLGV